MQWRGHAREEPRHGRKKHILYPGRSKDEMRDPYNSRDTGSRRKSTKRSQDAGSRQKSTKRSRDAGSGRKTAKGRAQGRASQGSSAP